jgi:nucleoid-associated protein YgaU
MGFEVDDLDIIFDDGKATIKGAVDDNATRERVILTVGNTNGVGQVDDQLRVKTHVEPAAEEINRQKAETKFYTVVSGDSLSKIAKEFCGDPMRYPEIFEANEPMLKDPDLIYPGQVLRIPGTGGGDPGGAADSGGEARDLKRH